MGDSIKLTTAAESRVSVEVVARQGTTSSSVRRSYMRTPSSRSETSDRQLYTPVPPKTASQNVATGPLLLFCSRKTISDRAGSGGRLEPLPSKPASLRIKMCCARAAGAFQNEALGAANAAEPRDAPWPRAAQSCTSPYLAQPGTAEQGRGSRRSKLGSATPSAATCGHPLSDMVAPRVGIGCTRGLGCTALGQTPPILPDKQGNWRCLFENDLCQ